MQRRQQGRYGRHFKQNERKGSPHQTTQFCCQSGAPPLHCRTQFTTRRHPWVLLLDSDGQYGIENIVKLISEVETHAETKAVIGVRVHKHDSAFTQFGSAASGWLCNLFHDTHYRDFNCALKLVEGETLRSLSLEAKGLNYSGEVSSKLIERRHCVPRGGSGA